MTIQNIVFDDVEVQDLNIDGGGDGEPILGNIQVLVSFSIDGPEPKQRGSVCYQTGNTLDADGVSLDLEADDESWEGEAFGGLLATIEEGSDDDEALAMLGATIGRAAGVNQAFREYLDKHYKECEPRTLHSFMDADSVANDGICYR